LLDWTGLPEPEDRLVKKEEKRSTTFFQWLLNVSRSAYPEGTGEGYGYRPAIGEPHFEELIHIVERLSYLLCEQYYDSLYKRPPPYEVEFFELSPLGKFLRNGEPMSMYDIVIGASNYILDVVAEESARTPHVEAHDLLIELQKAARLLVFSLNYDTRVVDISYPWWTGFRTLDENEAGRRDSKAGIQVYDPQPSIPADVDAFVQMHGSIHFGWIAHYIAPLYTIARYQQPLSKHSTPRRNGFELWNDRSAMPTLTMITGFRKGEKTLVEPYASYFHYLRDEAFKTPYWLILGYGGGDPNVNAVLRSAADYWGGRLKAYVCNHLSSQDCGDGQSFREALKRRVGFMGLSGHRWMADQDQVENGQLSSGQCIRLSTDGLYVSHLQHIETFFAGH
jgi:hypothetical protein